MKPHVILIIAPFEGNSALAQRQALFLESVDKAEKDGVLLLAAIENHWSRQGWQTFHLDRDARSIGDQKPKPFLKDLFNLGLSFANPEDWLLYGNIDCSITPNLFQKLRDTHGTVVEYMRQDVEGDPQSLDELFTNPRQLFPIGLDAIAIRADFYQEARSYLPDFVVGEPHWDTIYSDLLRKAIPVKRDVESLYHPKHEQAWDVRSPTPAGQHNQDLFTSIVTSGYINKALIQDEPNVTDTAVIVVSFGNDPVRTQANMTGIKKQLQQDLYCDLYLVEMLSPSGESAYPAELLAQVKHLTVKSSSRHQNLFQKESLMNYGWRKVLESHDYQYFIFTDADIYAEDLSWFRQIRQRLQLNPAAAVQGYRIVQDTLDPKIQYSSLAAAYVFDYQTDLSLNPGLCWGLSRLVLEMGDGFNAQCLDCAGDSTFVREYLNWAHFQYDPYLDKYRWFQELYRELPFRAELDGVPVDIVHVHHGYLQERNYEGIRYAIDGLPPIGTFVAKDEQGLSFWRDENCIERQIMRRTGEMSDPNSVDRLFHEFNYGYSQRHGVSLPTETSSKPILPVPETIQFDSVQEFSALLSAANKSDGGLNIFNPIRVFREEYIYSWCDGVRTLDGSSFVPISNTLARPILVLETDGSLPYSVCCLPLRYDWSFCDLTAYEAIALSIRVQEADSLEITLQLLTKDDQGQEITSDHIFLEKLKSGIFQSLNIPLSLFQQHCDFPIHRTQILKISAKSPSKIEVAEIRVLPLFSASNQISILVDQSSTLPDKPIAIVINTGNRNKDRNWSIFNPVKVFGSEFQFSWCDGVKTLNNSSFIPISYRANLPTLVLEGDQSLPYIISCLPFQSSWEPFDLTPFTALILTICIDDLVTKDVTLQLVAQDNKAQEFGSDIITLDDWEQGITKQYTLPLNTFKQHRDFGLSQARIIKIMAGNAAKVELSKIYLLN